MGTRYLSHPTCTQPQSQQAAGWRGCCCRRRKSMGLAAAAGPEPEAALSIWSKKENVPACVEG